MKRADWILIGVFLGIAIMVAMIGISRKEDSLGSENLSVYVEQNGEMIHVLALHKDASISIPVDGGSSVLRIVDGMCYMESAPCPDQICVHHKPIQAVDESIICLPYKVVVWIKEDGN